MVKLTLKRVLSKKEVSSMVAGLIEVTGTPLSIYDADSSLLIGDGSDKSDRYPVKLAGEEIGWVTGNGNGSSVAALLTLLAGRELTEKSLANETLENYKEINLLYNVSEKMVGCLDSKEVTKLIIDEALGIIKGSCASALLLDEKTGRLDTVYATGKPRTMSPDAEAMKPGEGIAGNVFLTGQGEIINDVMSDPRFVKRANDIRSLICAPFKTKDKVLGVICISSTEPVTYTAHDLKLLSALALQGAIAIENARLYEELSETFLATVQTLAEAVEKRDPYTAGHTIRVMTYSLLVGDALRLSKKEMRDLELSAILHDIGKIGIRDIVLLKEGKLTDEEYKIMTTHSELGAEILRHIKQLNDMIPGVRGHHEKYNGSGYPDGLHGEDIPFIARIIAVADAFDAMTTDRPYRKGMNVKAAFAELKMCAGIQFDKDVVNAFMKVYDTPAYSALFNKQEGGLDVEEDTDSR